MSSLSTRLQQELARLKPARILIVQPDNNIAHLLSEHLADYHIQVVHNGRDAQTICEQNPPNLILIDTNLPDITPLQLFQQLLPIKFISHIPIFFLGQLEDNRAQRMKALEMGVDDYISKPFDIIELKIRVQNALPNPARTVDLVTGLPGWPAVHNNLQRRLAKGSDWSLMLVYIEYMVAYHDVYGAIAGQRARRAIADSLNEALDRFGLIDDFVGALSEQEFVLITSSDQHGRMLAHFQHQFQQHSRHWYTPQELALDRVKLPDGRRVPLMTPVTAVVSSKSQPFATPLAIIEAAEALCHRSDLPEPIPAALKPIFTASS